MANLIITNILTAIAVIFLTQVITSTLTAILVILATQGKSIAVMYYNLKIAGCV